MSISNSFNYDRPNPLKKSSNDWNWRIKVLQRSSSSNKTHHISSLKEKEFPIIKTSQTFKTQQKFRSHRLKDNRTRIALYLIFWVWLREIISKFWQIILLNTSRQPNTTKRLRNQTTTHQSLQISKCSYPWQIKKQNNCHSWSQL